MAKVTINPETGAVSAEGRPVRGVDPRAGYVDVHSSVVNPKEQAEGNGGGANGAANEGGMDWLPWVMGGGGALLAHSLASSLFGGSDEDRRKQSVWSRLLSALVPLGVGALGAYGGYALGNSLKTASAKKKSDIEIDVPDIGFLNDGNGGSIVADPSLKQEAYDALRARHGLTDPAVLLDKTRGEMADRADVAHAIGTGAGVVGAAAGLGGAGWNLLRKAEPLDPSAFNNARQARIELTAAKNNAASAKGEYKRVKIEEAGNLRGAKAGLKGAKRDARLAGKRLKQVQQEGKMYYGDGGPEYRGRLLEAQNEVQKARAAMDASRAKIDNTQGRIDDAGTRFRIAKANLATARDMSRLRQSQLPSRMRSAAKWLGAGGAVGALGGVSKHLGDQWNQEAFAYANQAQKAKAAAQQLRDAVQKARNGRK